MTAELPPTLPPPYKGGLFYVRNPMFYTTQEQVVWHLAPSKDGAPEPQALCLTIAFSTDWRYSAPALQVVGEDYSPTCVCELCLAQLENPPFPEE